jgi:hypothetical protein
VDVEQQVEQRQFLRLRGPDRLDAELEQRPPAFCREVAAHPGGHGLPVERSGVWGPPGRLQRDAPSQLVEAPLRALHVEQHDGVDARDRAAVAAQPAAVLDDVLALAVGREGVDPELTRERRQPVLGGPDPLAADLDDLPVADLLVEGPPAHPIARLDHDHGGAGAHRGAGGRQAGQAGPDHHEVGVAGLLVRHRRRSVTAPVGRYGAAGWPHPRAARARRSGV